MMRELIADENRAGYGRELEERLALAGCPVARDAMIRRETRGLVDADDEVEEEDELEDEEFAAGRVDQVLERVRAALDRLLRARVRAATKE